MKILLAEDNKESRNYLETFLRQIGQTVVAVENGLVALHYFKEEFFDLVLTDIKMPEMTGMELLRNISVYKSERDFDVLIFTGHGDMETAIEALKIGASDYLLKPIDIKVLAGILKRLEENQITRRRNQEILKRLSPEVNSQFIRSESGRETDEKLTIIPGIGEIGAFSKQMQHVVIKAMKFYCDRSLPVLLLGETGTGKEIVARLIHYGYRWENKPFMDINCATLTPSLFESELFGYEAGAFTGGQTKGGKGKIDMAMGGTLFLDEIGEMSIDLQAKLLRLIQEKEFYRVGGLKKIKADVRIICATNINIQKMVEEGRFRKDLYYRINVGQIILAPLRERKEDIIPLAEMFLHDFCLKRSKPPRNLGKQAKEVLLSYHWPGNVRELRNIMEYLVFNYDETEVEVKHLGLLSGAVQNEAAVTSQTNPLSTFNTADCELNKLVDELIVEALAVNNGNKTKTARFLGIARKTIYRHLDRLNINKDNE